MRSINILAIQRISPDDRAMIEASDPAIRLIDAGGWFEGEIRESWTDFAASRTCRPAQPDRAAERNAIVSSAKRK